MYASISFKLPFRTKLSWTKVTKILSEEYFSPTKNIKSKIKSVLRLKFFFFDKMEQNPLNFDRLIILSDKVPSCCGIIIRKVGKNLIENVNKSRFPHTTSAIYDHKIR